ncbi:hypothetical protein TheveDRAFT_1273 [Thermanaerovibrio velox DSM 12556]|uniref:Uncharacterized protein n=1 Tax=Thermanaerovibrio velox DSM 12556 TaxID=926567 RepID=H0UNA8_9BACT|nr:hypothetical protein [Thermanaerovibrio velox]EHM10393.1 hypothetical protein TheveDRAFT_1273 [Thermanaerovibrio velox DSM 12556]
MAMPMQISLEEVLSMLLARVDSLAINDENNKTKFNIVLRVLYKKGIVTDDDILESVREEHRMLKELGLLNSDPPEDMVKAMAEGILQWVKGDVEALKKSLKEYERRLQEYAAQEAKKPSIAVASSNVLQQLDKMGGPKGGGKLII